MVFNRNNFFQRTFCVFTEVAEWPATAPDYVSESGSRYYFFDDSVIRVSHHWGRAATCKWRLVPLADSKRGMRAGVAFWTDFKADVPGAALYWIAFDSVLNTYHYYHRDCAGYNNEPLANEQQTMKMLRKLRASKKRVKE